ncbi:MAG: hypothetical protein QM786_00470 [Breznakibacter sp.]
MTAKRHLKQLRTIFIVIVSGLMLFFFIAWALGTMRGALVQMDQTQLHYLKTVVLLSAFVGIPAAHYFHKKKTGHIVPNLSNVEKMVRFRTSYFIKLATFEGLGLVSLLAYLLSNDKTFLFVFGLFMVVLAINYPSVSKVAEELQSDPDELFEEDSLQTH